MIEAFILICLAGAIGLIAMEYHLGGQVAADPDSAQVDRVREDPALFATVDR
jgi:hypothetical protein